MPLVARTKQTDGRNLGGGGQMHNGGIIPDVDGAALQAGNRRQQVDGTDQIYQSSCGDRIKHGAGVFKLVRPAENGNTGVGRFWRASLSPARWRSPAGHQAAASGPRHHGDLSSRYEGLAVPAD